MRRILTILGSLLLVAFIAVPAFAHGPGRGKAHHRMRYWKGDPGYCRHYGGAYENLTEEQRSQLEKLSKGFHDTTALLRTEIGAKSAELTDLLNSPKPDPEKAKTLQKEISDLKAKMAQDRIDFRLEARKIAPELRLGRRYGKDYSPPGRGSGPGYGRHMKGREPAGSGINQ